MFIGVLIGEIDTPDRAKRGWEYVYCLGLSSLAGGSTGVETFPAVLSTKKPTKRNRNPLVIF
jgi:hypothetical protein